MSKSVIVGVVIAVLVLGGIGGGVWLSTRPKVSTGPAVTNSSLTQPPQVNASPASGSDELESTMDEETTGPVKEFTVTNAGLKFSPATLTVKKGDTVRITFKSMGMSHSFNIEEFDVTTGELAADEEEEVEFVADKAGTFAYYCGVGDHRSQGMVGKLVVQ